MLKLGGRLDEVGVGISKLTSGVQELMVQVVGKYFSSWIYHKHFQQLIIAESNRREVLKWLSNVDYKAHHEKTRSLQFENMGNWMFGKSAFVDWIETDTSSILWIHGMGMYFRFYPRIWLAEVLTSVNM